MTTTLIIKPSLEELLKRIKAVIDNPESRRRVLLLAVLELKDLAEGYPDEGEYNQPGTYPKRWYQRGYGARWARKSFTNSGTSFAGVGGSNTSQKLQESWRTEVQRKDEFTASAFTDVTYAPFLLDETKRVHWAAGHGWQTLADIEKDYAPRFEKIVLKELDDQIDKL